jgi:hypothetical protein
MEHTLPTGIKRKALMAALAVPCVAAGALVLYQVWANDPDESLLPLCLFHALTGLHCPGCGTARALHLILHGRLWAGFRMNPLAVAAAPFLFAVLGAALLRLWQGKPLPRLPRWVPWAALAVIVAFTVARNLPWMPFAWLAPTTIGG